MTITTFAPDSVEYSNLRVIANYYTATSPYGCRYTVEDVYFDYGQDWMWTTIVCYKPNGDDYQVLYPNEHEKIVLETDNTTLFKIADKIREKTKNMGLKY